MRNEPLIILAEDDAGHVELLRRGLGRLGVRGDIIHLRDGREVLDFFSGMQAGERPHLLFLDIRMPKVDGIEVLSRIRQDPAHDSLPVIIISTTVEPREIEKCYALGCSAYLSKPVETAELAEALRRAGEPFITDGV